MQFSSSGQVDSRVVELKFENQQFEQNAKTSLSTLDRLKAALDFSKTKQTFTDIGNGLKSISIAPLSNGIQQLTTSFSALDVIATRALMNITDSIQSAATGFLSSVTIDQVSAGWQKYADKTSSVQTIMAATAKNWNDTGAQMEYVNSQLEKLNWYSDETSYSFIDMVNNIGKFTSNNVDLEKSVTAMEGISNWAAISGANVSEAGRAMYNLSQAIAVGSVKLMDWKSIENANMATAEFKETAIETAVKLGTLTKAGDGLYKTLKGNEVSIRSFNQTLSDGWFTSDVLLTTLEKYGAFTDKLNAFYEAAGEKVKTSDILEYIDEFKKGELKLTDVAKETGLTVDELKGYLTELSSEENEFGIKAFKAAQEAKTFEKAVEAVKDAVSTGWMNTYEIMFGNYLEAKELWTDLANQLTKIFAEGGDSRNKLLKDAFSQQENLTDLDYKKLSKLGLMTDGYAKALREATEAHDQLSVSATNDIDWLEKAFKEQIVTIDDLNAAYDSLFGGDFNTHVNKGIEEAITAAKDSDEGFKTLYETLEKYKDEDLANVIFGDHAYKEGSEELEKTLDSMMKTLGYTQDQGDEFVEALRSMGLFGGMTAEAISKMSDEQLKNKGYTEDEIKTLREAIKAGKDYREAIDEIDKAKVSTGDLWTETLTTGMQMLVDIVGVAQDAWADVFPPATADNITDIVTKLHDGVSALSNWVNESDTLHNTFEAVFSVLGVVATTVKDLATGALGILNSVLDGLGINVGDLVNRVDNAVIKFREWYSSSHPVASAMRLIAKVAGEAAKAVRGLYDRFIKLPFVSGTLGNFKTGFIDAFASLPKFFDGLGGAFDDFLKKVDELGGFKFENIGSIFEVFKSTIWDYIAKFEGFKTLKEAFVKLKDDAIKLISDMAKGIWKKLEDLQKKLKGTFAGDAFGAVMGGFKKLWSTVKELFSGNKSISDIAGEGLTLGLDTIRGAFEKFFGVIKGILGGINWLQVGKYAIVFLVIKKIFDFIKNMKEGINGVMHPVEAIGSVFDTLSDAVESMKQKVQVNIIKSIALAIGILVGCVFLLSQLSIPQLAKGIIAVGLIGALVAGLMWAMTKISSGSTGKMAVSGGFLVAFGLAVGLLALCVKSLGELDPEVLQNGLVAVGFIGAIVVAIGALLNGTKLKMGSGVALAIIALSIKMLAGLIEPLGTMDPEVLQNGLVAIGILGLIVAGIGYILKSSNLKATSGVAIALIVLSIKMLAGLIEPLGAMDPEVLQNGLVAVGLLGAILAALSWAIGKTDIGVLKSIGTLGLAAAIAILSEVVAKLSTLDPGGLKQAELALAILSACLAIATRIIGSSKVSLGSSIGALAISGAIMILANAMLTLSKIPVRKLQSTLIAFSVIALALGSLSMIIGNIKGISIGGILSVVAIAASLGILMLALSKLSEQKPENLVAAAGALAILGVVLGGLTLVASVVGPASASLLIIVGAVGLLALIIGLLANFTDPDRALKTVKALSIAMLAITGMMLGLALAGLGAAGIAAVLPLLGIIIGVFGALTVIFGLIDKFTNGGAADVVSRGVEIMVQIGDGLGRFFGAIIKGFAVETMSALPEMADYLVQFMEKMQGLNGLSGINWGILLEALGAITATSFTELLTALPNAVTQFATGRTAVEQFSDDITNLSSALSTWADTVNGMGAIEVDNEGIAKLSAAIGAIALLEIGDAISSMITSFAVGEGVTAVEQFSNNLTTLSDGLHSWQESMQNFGTIDVPSDAISALADEISKISWSSLADAFKNFLPELISGDSGVEKFKNDTGKLADALLEWQSSMDSLGNVSVPQETIEGLISAISSIPESGILDSIAQAFGAKTDLDKFSSNLETLAGGLTDFVNKLEPYSDSFSNIGSVAAGILEGASSLMSVDLSSSNGGMADSSLVDNLVNNVKSLVDLINNQLANLDTSGVDSFKSAVEALANTDISAATEKLSAKTDGSELKAMQDTGKNMGTSLASSMGSQSGAMESAMGTLTGAATKALSDAQGSFGAKGTELVQAMASAVQSSGDLGPAFNSVVSSALSSIDVSGAYTAGYNFVAGFANGISMNTFMAVAQARAMAQAAINAANAQMQSHSPARVLIKSGKYFAEGFAIGIDQLSYLSVRAAKNMAQGAVDGMSRAIDSVREILSADLDGDPVVRPVLDLTEIEAGAGTIGGLLSNVQPIRLMSDLDIIQTNSRAMRNRASTDDLIAAISSLEGGGTTNNYNVVDGVTYDDGSNIAAAVRTLVHAVRAGGRA